MHLPDSKTVNGIADMPMTDRSREVVAEFSPSPPAYRCCFRSLALDCAASLSASSQI